MGAPFYLPPPPHFPFTAQLPRPTKDNRQDWLEWKREFKAMLEKRHADQRRERIRIQIFTFTVLTLLAIAIGLTVTEVFK